MALSVPLGASGAASVDQIGGAVHDICWLLEFCPLLATLLQKLGRLLGIEVFDCYIYFWTGYNDGKAVEMRRFTS
ncbi:MAG: hypothetical protein ACRCVD_09190 [Halioglobus sp.]